MHVPYFYFLPLLIRGTGSVAHKMVNARKSVYTFFVALCDALRADIKAQGVGCT
jgi:hypothetical protein